LIAKKPAKPKKGKVAAKPAIPYQSPTVSDNEETPDYIEVSNRLGYEPTRIDP
jgi:hypothetical protein